jgi:predicted nucleic acid-binding Zn ribbon protein
MAVSENKMTPLGEALKDVFKELGLEKDLLKARILSEWPQIIGKSISDKVNAVRFDGGFLVLSSESSVWKNEIMLRKNELISKINSRINSEIVLDIRFK